MAQIILESEIIEIAEPDLNHLITEDDTPVDNLFSEKQQRLLIEVLYSSWLAKQPFLAATNVAIYSSPRRPAIVPDMFLSLDVQVAEDWWAKQHRSYFLWEFGKPPEVVVEIVSNAKGQENDQKLRDYARLGVLYYVIYDPQRLLQPQVLQLHELHVGEYLPKTEARLENVGLSLSLWDGLFEGKQSQWLRWATLDGALIPTGAERAERLAAQLRALGIEPEA
jgi:Uma2 family endonuclease